MECEKENDFAWKDDKSIGMGERDRIHTQTFIDHR